MNYTVRRIDKEDFSNVVSYVGKYKNYEIKLLLPEIIVSMNEGALFGILHDNKKIEGLCIMMNSKTENGIFIPFLKINSNHVAKITMYTLFIEMANYIKDKTIVVQYNKKIRSKYLIDCGNNTYGINIPLARKNFIYRFINDTFFDVADVSMDTVIVNFQKEYLEAFPKEMQPYTKFIKKARELCTFKIETQYHLLYVRETEDSYEVLAEWLLANKNYDSKTNRQIFRDVAKVLKGFNKKVVYNEGLKKVYHGLAKKSYAIIPNENEDL